MRNANELAESMKDAMPFSVCICYLLSIILLSGCASHSTKHPAWLINPQINYPETEYLVAIGEGDTRRAAENNAAASLARIFESRIHAEDTLSERTTEERGNINRLDQRSELQTKVQIESEQELLNIQFGENYTDTHGRIHVAATIPRAETAAIYRERIGENEKHLLLLISLSDTASDPIARYAFRRTAVRKALENDRLIAQLDIIHPGARTRLKLGYDPQTLYSETASAAQKITFAVNLTGAGGDALRETLTGMGFSEKDNAPSLAFSGDVTFEETDLKRGALVFVRYRYQLETRTQNQQLVMALNNSRREGHISFKEAAARAKRSLRRELQTEVSRELGDYFDRLASAE